MSIKPSQVIVFTRAYQFAHGRMPSGTGNWAFHIGGATEPVFYPFSLYSIAKKLAQADAVEQGKSYVQVAP